MLFSVSSFLYEYFGKTIIEDAGYNIVNTITYAVIALSVFFFIIVPLIKKFYGKVDFSFALFLVFIVSTGAMFRVMEESYSSIHLFTRSISPFEWGFYFITPGIYFLFLAVAVVLILIAYFVSKKNNFNKGFFLALVSGILFTATFIFMLFKMTLIRDFFIILFSMFGITVVIYLLLLLFKQKLTNIETLAVAGQVIDGVATFSALTFYPNFSEQHVVGNLIISGIGLWAFPVLKIIIVLVLIFLLRYYKLEESKRNVILLFVILFGFATGVRDVFSIASQI